MSDEKILKEIKGIFGWIKIIKEEENKKKTPLELEKERKNMLSGDDLDEKKTYNQLKEFLSLLKVEASHEEIEALDELANPEKEDEITFENLYNVFVKNEEETEKENIELKSAFKNLSLNKEENFIDLMRLEDALGLYDPKYKNSMEKILNEIESSKSARNGKFYYNEYIDEQFALKKKS